MKPWIWVLFLASTSVFAQKQVSLQNSYHFLNRVSFGPRPGEVEDLVKKTPNSWLETQMNPDKISDLKIDEALKKLPSLAMTNAERLKAYPRAKNNMEGSSNPRAMYSELISQKLIRAVNSEKQFQEVMTDFWFNHFNVDFNKGLVKWYITSYERDAIRPHVFGDFRTLLGATAKNPAMLFYLDAFQSVKEGFGGGKRGKGKVKGINENYARELMELHTLGVDGGYTQNDIKEVARALTGWTIDKPQVKGEFIFKPMPHDSDAKKIMGLNLLSGGGVDDGEKVLDYLAAHPSTAKFIAKKLCVKFISDIPPQSAIDKVAAEFLATKGDLKAVYRKLFSLDEFWDAKVHGSKVKTPFEFVASSLRALNGEMYSFNRPRNQLVGAMERMGQPLYRCQPPTGFKATADFWVNPGALVNRIQLGLLLANDQLQIADIDIKKLKELARTSSGLEGAIKDVDQLILHGRLTEPVKKRLLEELNTEPKVTQELPITKLVGLMLGSPEFQRR